MTNVVPIMLRPRREWVLNHKTTPVTEVNMQIVISSASSSQVCLTKRLSGPPKPLKIYGLGPKTVTIAALIPMKLIYYSFRHLAPHITLLCARC